MVDVEHMSAEKSANPNGVSQEILDRHERVAEEILCEERYQLRIGGAWVDSDGGDTAEIDDPTTGTALGAFQLATASDVDRAVGAAEGTFRNDWGEYDPLRRADLLDELADRIEQGQYAERIAKLDALEAGIPRAATERMVSEQIVTPFRFYAGVLRSVETGSTRASEEDLLVYTRQEPYGVVGVIAPWNAPAVFIGTKLAPALAAGNTIVVKPSPRGNLSHLALAELFDDVLPAGTVNIVTGGVEAGGAISRHEGIRKVSITGSVEAGRAVMTGAAESNLKSTTLELGGKSPHVIFPDADLRAAAMGATIGVFQLSGQICYAGSRLFVHGDVYDEFLSGLRAVTEKVWTQGDPLESETTYGPLIDRDSLTRVETYVENALDNGAELFMGGDRPAADGFGDAPFYEPTVLTNVDPDDPVACEEIFGPVLSVIEWTDRDSMLDQANDSEFGLAAGLWTENLDTAHEVSAELEAGTVWVNCYAQHSVQAPFGGYKRSGHGRENGIEGLEEMSQTKSVTVNLGDFPR